MANRKYDHELIVRLLRADVDRRVIAEEAGCPIDTVYALAARHGLSRQKQKRSPSSPTQSAGLYGPIVGVDEKDAVKVARSVIERVPAADRADVLGMLFGAVA